MANTTGKMRSGRYTVTIEGTGFQQGAVVTFDNTQATINSLADEEIVCEVPTPHAPGTVAVVVVNPDGQSASTTFTYDGDPLTIVSINPEHGPGNP